MTLDPAVQALLDQLSANPAPKLWELPVADGRALYLAMSQMLEPQGVPIGKVENMTVPGPAGPIPVRLYTPMGGGTMRPAIVFYHGGGWVIGSLETHDALCRQLANESGCKVVAVDYRLAPEHKAPAAFDDAFAVAQWVETNAPSLEIDANRLAVAGDSAGGNLAAAVSIAAKHKGAPKISYQLLIYPTLQMRPNTQSMKDFAEGYFLERKTMDWFYDQYLPSEADINDPRYSPLAASDLAGVPRAYIVTAGFDPLKDEGKAFADKLNRAGVAAVYVNYDGMIHGFFNMSAAVPSAKQAISAAASAVKEALK
jgi:acetyl esterase